MARLRLLILLVSLLGLLCGSAHAATVSRDSLGLRVNDTGATQEDNTITVTHTSGTWTVSEANYATAPLSTTDADCSGSGATVTCSDGIAGGALGELFVTDWGGTNSYTNSTDLPSLMNGDDGADTLTGGSSTDNLNGSNGNDVLDGAGGTNSLQGGGGNDVLKGGTGASDYTVADYSDHSQGVTVTIGDGANDGTVSSGEADDVQSTINAVTGSSHDDTITAGGGGFARRTLRGGAGDDHLNAGDAPGAVLIGEAGADTLTGGAGFDVVAYDYLGSTPGVTATLGGASPGGGPNGSATDQDVYAGSIEELDGSGGNDTLTGSDVNDYLKGDHGDDTLDGGAGNDHLYGDRDIPLSGPTSDKDTLTGGAGSDRLVGNEDDDVLNNDDGEADTLGGGSDCDGPLALSTSAGTADVIHQDAADTQAINCESSGGVVTPTVTLSQPTSLSVHDDRPTFSGTAGAGPSDDGFVHIQLEHQDTNGVVDSADLGFDTAVAPDGTFNAQYPNSLADGRWYVKAQQNLGASNQASSATITFRVDTHGPSPTVTSPSDGSVVTEAQPTISGTGSAGEGDSQAITVEIRQFGELRQILHPARFGTSWSVKTDPLSPGGTYTVTATQSDDLGHTTTSPAITFRYGVLPKAEIQPAFSGPGTVGSNMHASVGSWSGTEPIKFTVLWQRCPTTNLNDCFNVSGGIYPDGVDYKVSAADIGYRLILKIVASNPAGTTSAYSPTFTGIVPDPNGGSGIKNGIAAGNAGTEPPALNYTPAQTAPAGKCQTDLYFGPIGVHANCFQRVGLTWEATGDVSANGLHLVANGGAKVVIDPMNLRIGAKGKVKVVAGPAQIGAVKISAFTLYEGEFNWVFQPNVTLPDFPGLATAIPGAGGVGSLPSLGKLSGLPGLGSMDSLKRIPGLGLPDFSTLSVADLKALHIPTLDEARMQIPAFYLPVSALPKLSVDTTGAGDLFGFPISGHLGMRFVDDGAEFDAGLALKQFGDITVDTHFKVFNTGAFKLDDISAHAGEVNAVLVSLRPFDLHYDAAQDLWSAKATAYLPFPGATTGFGAAATVEKGSLTALGFQYAGNVAIGPSGVFLSNVEVLANFAGGGLSKLNAKVGLTAGPKLGSLPAAFSLDGVFNYTAGNPALFELTGNAAALGYPFGEARFKYWTNGNFDVHGRLGVKVGPKDIFGVEGIVDGWSTKSAWNATGKVSVSGPGFNAGVDAVASSKGIAGCGQLGIAKGGVGYVWGHSSLDWFGGTCDLSVYTAVKTASVSQAGGGRTVTLGKGLDVTAFAVQGAGAPPAIALKGPDGATVSSPGAGAGVHNDKFWLVPDPTTNTTYVMVAKPAAGAWSVTPLPGSATITAVNQADQLPDVDVKAKVKGHGDQLKLSWKLAPIKGQSVQFVERADKVARVLTTSSAKAGTLKFSPADGPQGGRTIEAVVLENGLVRKQFVVARFTAPKPAKLAAPRSVKVARKGTTLKVSWTKVAGAVRYRVYATVNGGRKVLVAPANGVRKAVVDEAYGDTAATVKVVAVDGQVREGKPKQVKLKAPKIRKVVLKGLKVFKKH